MIKLFNDRIVHTDGNRKKTKLASTELLRFLSDNVELDKNFTFGSLIEMLHSSTPLVNIIFGNSLGFYPFEDFYQDYLKDVPVDQVDDYKNEYLEVYYVPDLWKFSKKKPFDFHPYYGFHLIKLKDVDGDNIPYGISFTSISEYKNHNIRINKNIDFYFHDTTVPSPAKYEPTHRGKLETITLFDFLQAILYEISWHGSPENRDARAKEIMEMDYDFTDAKILTVDQLKELLENKKESDQ